MKVAWFSRANDTKPQSLVRLETVAAACRGEGNSQLAKTTRQRGALVENAREACIAEWGADDWMTQVKRRRNHPLTRSWFDAKTALPAVCFSAHFDGNRRADNVSTLTGLVALDVDEVPQDDWQAALRRVQAGEFPFVLLMYRTPSQTGGRVVAQVKIPSDVNEACSRRLCETYSSSVWYAAAWWVEDAFGFEGDPATKDAPRLSFIGLDSDSYWSGISDAALSVDDVPPPPKPAPLRRTFVRNNEASGQWKLGAAAEALDWCDPDCGNEEWVSLVFAALDAGATESEIESWSRRSAKFDRQARYRIRSMARQSGRGGGRRATAGTLWFKARQAGMPEDEMNDLLERSTDWVGITQADRDAADLIDDSVDSWFEGDDSVSDLDEKADISTSANKSSTIHNHNNRRNGLVMSADEEGNTDISEMILELGQQQATQHAELTQQMGGMTSQIGSLVEVLTQQATGAASSNGVADEHAAEAASEVVAEKDKEQTRAKPQPKKSTSSSKSSNGSAQQQPAQKRPAASKKPKQAKPSSSAARKRNINTDGFAPRHTIDDRPDVRAITQKDFDEGNVPDSKLRSDLESMEQVIHDPALLLIRPDFQTPCVLMPTGFLVPERFQDDPPRWRAAVDFVYVDLDDEVRVLPAFGMAWNNPSIDKLLRLDAPLKRLWQENQNYETGAYQPKYLPVPLDKRNAETRQYRILKAWFKANIEQWGESETSNGTRNHYQLKVEALEAAVAANRSGISQAERDAEDAVDDSVDDFLDGEDDEDDRYLDDPYDDEEEPF